MTKKEKLSLRRRRTLQFVERVNEILQEWPTEDDDTDREADVAVAYDTWCYDMVDIERGRKPRKR